MCSISKDLLSEKKLPKVRLFQYEGSGKIEKERVADTIHAENNEKGVA